MSAPNGEKGARYLGLLDQALCSGSWSEITELARKTEKHAPARKCLALSARTEAQIAASSSQRPSTAQSTAASRGDTDNVIAKLKEAIGAEQTYPGDAFIASVCIAEVYWLRGDGDAALDALPREAVATKEDTAGALGWLEVCNVRSAVIRASVAEQKEQDESARTQYLSAASKTPGTRSPELRRWTERLLARACLFTFRSCSEPTLRSLSESLCCFLTWSEFWQRSTSATTANVIRPSDISRRQVWQSYYDLLSVILQHQVVLNPTPTTTADLLFSSSHDMPAGHYAISKQRQRLLFKEVETVYESLLLDNSKFPKADQSNAEVEIWVDKAVRNWTIFCSPQWADDDLEEGGKPVLTRNLIDLLYRAATKTFHSTSILRHLFTAHAAIGEFDLSMYAYDSYAELIGKAKSRAETAHDHALEGENTVLTTASEAIRILCRYGDRDQAKKAFEISHQIQEWLNPIDKESDATDALVLAGAYRAMAIAQAHWARLTYESEMRPALQADALAFLRKSLAYDDKDMQTAYTLASLLAEMGEVQAAIQILKQSIASVNGLEDDEEPDDYVTTLRERQSSALWHLLALCLTAMDDYEQAAKMCEVAFDQFGDPTALFGSDDSTATQDPEKESVRSSGGLVDKMDGFEKERILQVRITQLALVELMEGPGSALEISHSLLGLYARLFGNPGDSLPLSGKVKTTAATTQSGGSTLRSLTGSGRPKPVWDRSQNSTLPRTSYSSTARPGTHSVSGSAPDSSFFDNPIHITVTNEENQLSETPHHKQVPFKLRGTAGDWRQMSSFTSKSKDGVNPKMHVEGDPKLPSFGNGSQDLAFAAAAATGETKADQDPRQKLEAVSHNAPHDVWPPPTGHDVQPPLQDIRLPAPHPAAPQRQEPFFASLQDRQHRIGALVNVWLFIAGIYVRADLVNDADEAVEEAEKLVEAFEIDVAEQHSQARRFFDKGWAGGKSVDELWADVLSAKGELAACRDLPFEAIALYDQALSYYPDHPVAIIGVSNILLDIYEEKLSIEPPEQPLPQPSLSISQISRAAPVSVSANSSTGMATSTHEQPDAMHLSRLSARDRAYMLLSNLTRSGHGWDNSEAWATLARAQELSRQITKAKQALWWVVKLEGKRPVRAWRDTRVGGYTF